MQTNIFLRRAILTGIFITPFLAFFVSGSLLFPFIAGKNFAFRIIVEILFALWVILALRDEDYLPRRSWILYAYSAFFFIIACADLFGANPSRSFWSNFERMDGLIAHIHFYLYFIVLSSVLYKEKLWNWFLGTWVGAGTIMSFYGLLQVAGKITINQGGVRLDGTFGNATYLAVFLLFTFFFTAFSIVRAFKNTQRLWYLIPIAILQLVVLYLTATRGAILGLIGGLIVAGIVIAWKEKENVLVRKSAIGLLGGIVLLISVFFLARNTEFVTTSPVLSRFSSLSFSEIKTQGRYFIWPMAIEGFKENPVLGLGQENFGIIFSKNYNPKMYNQEQWFDRAHSAPLDWLVAGGSLAFLAYLSLFGTLIWYLFKRNGFGLPFTERALLFGLVSAYFFQGLFVFDNLFSNLLFFTILAFVHTQSEGQKFTLPVWVKDSSVRGVTSGIVVFLVILTLYFWNVKPIVAGQTLIKAMQSINNGDASGALSGFTKVFTYNTFASGEAREQLVNSSSLFLSPQVPNDVKEQYVQLAQKELQNHLKENPDDARSHVFYATFLGNIGQGALSVEAFKKAEALSPNKQTILMQLGGAYIASGDYKLAQETFKKAYELDRAFEQAQILYGIGAIYLGDIEQANEILSTVDQNILLFDDRIVSALATIKRYGDLVQIFNKRLETEEGKKNPQNYVSLAISYVEAGDKENARKVLNTLKTIDPGYTAQVDAYSKQMGL